MVREALTAADRCVTPAKAYKILLVPYKSREYVLPSGIRGGREEEGTWYCCSLMNIPLFLLLLPQVFDNRAPKKKGLPGAPLAQSNRDVIHHFDVTNTPLNGLDLLGIFQQLRCPKDTLTINPTINFSFLWYL